MFGWGRAFKTRGHYVFDYKPRYYDERKERLDKLREKYKDSNQTLGQLTNEEDDISPIVFSKNELRKAWTRSKTKPSDSNDMRRLAIILTILIGIVVYLLDFHHLF